MVPLPILEAIRISRFSGALRRESGSNGPTSYADEKEKARQILIDLVDENVERLAAKLEAFVEKIDDLAETSMTRLSFDHSPQGERLRSYLLKFKNGLERGLKNLEKSKAKRDEGGWNEPRRSGGGRPERGGRWIFRGRMKPVDRSNMGQSWQRALASTVTASRTQ